MGLEQLICVKRRSKKRQTKCGEGMCEAMGKAKAGSDGGRFVHPTVRACKWERETETGGREP
jgi:uncharacterized low-complexity protein